MLLTHLRISLYLLQVVIEGVAGVTFASSIAVDDFDFSTNLTCVSVGEPTPQETFQGNVLFNGEYSYTCTFALRYALYKARSLSLGLRPGKLLKGTSTPTKSSLQIIRNNFKNQICLKF